MRPIAALTLALALWLPLGASAADYDPRRAGHPLRIAAYCLHPVGVILDYLIFRPAWYIGGVEPIRTLVGRDLELRETEIEVPNEPATP
jgi:hypothetical protein